MHPGARPAGRTRLQGIVLTRLFVLACVSVFVFSTPVLAQQAPAVYTVIRPSSQPWGAFFPPRRAGRIRGPLVTSVWAVPRAESPSQVRSGHLAALSLCTWPAMPQAP